MIINVSSRYFLRAFIIMLLLNFPSFAGFKLKPTVYPAKAFSEVRAASRVTFKDAVRFKIAQIRNRFQSQPEMHKGGNTSAFGISAATMGLSGILCIILGLLATTAGIFFAGCILGLLALPVGIIGCIGKKRMKGLAVSGIVVGALTLSFVLLILAAIAAFS